MKPRPLAVLFPLSALLLPLLSGCASNPDPQLVIQSIRDRQTFTEGFATAYASQSAGGDTSVVLIDRAAQEAAEGHAGPAPVRQVMSIRVMWNPQRDMKWDHGSASNATIHWYVMGNTPATAAEVIEYSGTANVLVDRSEGSTTLTLRSASIRPVAWRGSLHDPIGPSELRGSVRAADNPQRVRQILSDVRTVVAAANSLPNVPASAEKPESPSTSAR